MLKTIVIDPGHGGKDPGAVGKFSKEKDINLKVGLKLRDKLKNCGIKILMTRETDILLGDSINQDLDNRVNFANQNKADYFVSIHCNSTADVSAKGIETFAYKSGGDGEKLANIVQNDLINATGLVNRGVKFANFVVLRKTDMPAILVEIGFLSNEAEEKLLNDEAFLETVSNSIAKSICKFVGIEYVTSEHWAKKHLDSLVNKGIIDSPEKWSNFDATLSTKTIGELLGLIDKATGKISSVLQEEIKPQENNEIKHTETQKTESAKYYKVSLTDVVEIDPMTLRISIQDKPANKITLQNFVTSGYQMMQANGEAYPLGILVSEGKVIQNRQPHNLPAGTLIIYKDGKVDVKPMLDITQEKNVWFAVSGCSILPKIAMTEEGFSGQFSDIGRKCNRPVIGYNPIKNKIIVAVRPDSDISRGQLTLINLGCTKGITLDAGGSTVLRVNGEFKFNTTRQLYSVITW